MSDIEKLMAAQEAMVKALDKLITRVEEIACRLAYLEDARGYQVTAATRREPYVFAPQNSKLVN